MEQKELRFYRTTPEKNHTQWQQNSPNFGLDRNYWDKGLTEKSSLVDCAAICALLSCVFRELRFRFVPNRRKGNREGSHARHIGNILNGNVTIALSFADLTLKRLGLNCNNAATLSALAIVAVMLISQLTMSTCNHHKGAHAASIQRFSLESHNICLSETPCVRIPDGDSVKKSV